MMRLDKLSVSAAETLQAAMGIAGDAEAGALGTVHLLKALLDNAESNISSIIERVGAEPAELRRQVDSAIAAAPRVSNNMQMGMEPAVAKVIEGAVDYATKMDDNYATNEHLLMALADDTSVLEGGDVVDAFVGQYSRICGLLLPADYPEVLLK